MAPLFGGLAS